jgi:hypothetical protein
MLKEALRLLEPLLLTILDTTPSAVIIHLCRSAQWHTEDFDILWMNKAAREQLSHLTRTGRLVPTSEANQKIIQSSLNELHKLAQTMGGHHTGFIGPFPITSILPDGREKQFSYSLMYAGDIGDGLPVILQATHEKVSVPVP